MADYWRRTADGWQWLPPVEKPVTFLALHPLTVAAFIFLASLLGMLTLDVTRQKAQTEKMQSGTAVAQATGPSPTTIPCDDCSFGQRLQIRRAIRDSLSTDSDW